MKVKTVTSILLATMIGAFFLATAPANATSTNPNEDHKVTLCHRTGSAAGGNQHNGYNIITVDIASSGYVKGGHTGHEQVGNGPGPDIIPAYEAFAKDGKDWVPFSFPGMNLDYVFSDGTTGAEFLANGCQLNTPEAEVTVVSVDFFDPTCEEPNGSLLTDYNSDEADVRIEGEVGPGQEVSVIFTAKDGYVIEGQTVFTHTFGDVPENCSPATIAKPHASIDTKCGSALVTLSNGEKATENARFVVKVDSTKEFYEVEPGDTIRQRYDFAEDSGRHWIVVDDHGFSWVDSVFTNCEQTPPNHPDNPNNPDENQPPLEHVDELPHTGGGNAVAVALSALGMIVVGAGAKLFAILR